MCRGNDSQCSKQREFQIIKKNNLQNKSESEGTGYWIWQHSILETFHCLPNYCYLEIIISVLVFFSPKELEVWVKEIENCIFSRYPYLLLVLLVTSVIIAVNGVDFKRRVFASRPRQETVETGIVKYDAEEAAEVAILSRDCMRHLGDW